MAKVREARFRRSAAVWVTWVVWLATLAAGCATEKLAANMAVDLAARTKSSFSQESDLELARGAAASGLKQLEGFLLVTGKRPDLLAMLTEGFCGWGAGFLQDDWEVAVIERGADGAEIAASARSAFGRCARYAAWQLPAPLARILELTDAEAQVALAAARPVDAAPLYWLTAAHATLLGMTGELGLALRLPRMLAVLRRVIELSPTFEHGQAHLLLGVLLSAAPVGGDLEEGGRQLARARALSDGRLLIVDVLTARAHAVARGDRARFVALLTRVLATSPVVFPEQRLSNELAHRMARRYLRLGARWFAPLPR